jgi:hypothetical protein
MEQARRLMFKTIQSLLSKTDQTANYTWGTGSSKSAMSLFLIASFSASEMAL